MTKTLQDYLDRVTPFHATRPDYIAVLTLLLQPFVDAQALLASIPHAFDLDFAIGVQLDAVGEWVGQSRQINTPLMNLFFSLDTLGLGFDTGVWQGPYAPPTGITSLDDDTYRALLYAVVAANRSDGTVVDTLAITQAFFNNPVISNPGTLLFLDDKQDMSYVVGIAGEIPGLLYLALLETDVFERLHPAGVDAIYLVTSVNNTPLFGFDVYNQYVAGFDTGSWGMDPIAFINSPIYTNPALNFRVPINSQYLPLLDLTRVAP